MQVLLTMLLIWSREGLDSKFMLIWLRLVPPAKGPRNATTAIIITTTMVMNIVPHSLEQPSLMILWLLVSNISQISLEDFSP
jgi:hypothetical protein